MSCVRESKQEKKVKENNKVNFLLRDQFAKMATSNLLRY